jgi:hypothetical protein
VRTSSDTDAFKTHGHNSRMPNTPWCRATNYPIVSDREVRILNLTRNAISFSRVVPFPVIRSNKINNKDLICLLIGEPLLTSPYRVNARTILEAINGYSPLGIMFGLAVPLPVVYEPEAFSWPALPTASSRQECRFSDHLYYAFTTVGSWIGARRRQFVEGIT